MKNQLSNTHGRCAAQVALVIPLAAFLFGSPAALAGPITLGSAQSFAILGASTVTNTGPTVINGDLGLYPGTSITGFPPGIVNGTIHQTDAVAMTAQSDVTSAYDELASLGVNQVLTGMDLGGLTLLPGVYFFASSAQLTGTLTLNAMGDPDALFVFQIGSTLTTSSASSIEFTDGLPVGGVYWQVGSSATLGTATAFAGNILADQSITLNTSATITCGRALAENGAVTMDTNVVSIGGCEATGGGGGGGGGTPEPRSVLLLGMGLLFLTAYGQRLGKRMA